MSMSCDGRAHGAGRTAVGGDVDQLAEGHVDLLRDRGDDGGERLREAVAQDGDVVRVLDHLGAEQRPREGDLRGRPRDYRAAMRGGRAGKSAPR